MIPTIEAKGLRQLLRHQGPPRGTPSKILATRLRRCYGHLPPFPISTAPARIIFPRNGLDISTRCMSQSHKLSFDTSAPAIESRSDQSADAHLADLLRAVQSQDTTQIVKSVKGLACHPRAIEAADALQRLPPTTFSEIVRSLDPSRVGPRSNATHDLRIENGLGQYSSLASVADRFGVPKIYKSTFQSLRTLFGLRSYHGSEPSRLDYVVLLRCAGAASDVQAAKEIWDVTKGEEDSHHRNGQDYTEYFKTRFLTDPAYSHNDKARLRVRLRDLHGRRKNIKDTRILWPLERLRLSLVANRRFTYGRASWEPTHDLHRLLSLPAPIGRLNAFIRKKHKVVDEEYYCAYLVACARAGSVREMTRILYKVWGILITDRDHRAATIVKANRADSNRRTPTPTQPLINAIMQSFGCTGHVILARKLIEYISAEWGISIPPDTWSSLLEWTYLVSSKPVTREYKTMSDKNRVVRSNDVLAVWDAMTANPHLGKPGFRDLDIYTRSLVASGKLDEAWDSIRHTCAEYDSLCKDVEAALFETLFPSPPPASISRHHRLKAQQHMSWYSIQRSCQQWLRQASVRLRREPALGSQIIPDFVNDFRRFLPDPITYSTYGGTVRILNQDIAAPKTKWVKQIVRSEPTRRLAPDPSRPKVSKQDGAAEDAEAIPIVTEAGDPVYESMTITLRRSTRRMVRQRREVRFGEQENRLRFELGKSASRGVVNEGEAISTVEALNSQRLPQTGPLFRKEVLKALVW
ncbi:hypothetical protein CABS01_13452 [Colletotrichum abscissum]|uniref:Pentatricopeptide repeat domain-containing protein n=1 Tax=Colletotrichum abscissum TaxID=1671311 RepID=A0A9P9XDP0_9PEZI|nr:uncharacterized protein CABS01_13452 [Colletotrichum abscissum]KAI3550394.1 hypothetical protein CABS02_07615 [Colletotrichum abscissum]KAK1485759.1 hypothetical protein CABS01_13452 [Colletotrichum abscissum]